MSEIKTMASSIHPTIGIKSGMKSNGNKMYATAKAHTSLTGFGFDESFAAVERRTKRFTSM